jgi:hypothetical protein
MQSPRPPEPKGGIHPSYGKLQGGSAEFATIYPGHGRPMPSTFIGQQIACVEGILHGSIRGAAALFHRRRGGRNNKTATVAHNTENLRVKK